MEIAYATTSILTAFHLSDEIRHCLVDSISMSVLLKIKACAE